MRPTIVRDLMKRLPKPDVQARLRRARGNGPTPTPHQALIGKEARRRLEASHQTSWKAVTRKGSAVLSLGDAQRESRITCEWEPVQELREGSTAEAARLKRN